MDIHVVDEFYDNTNLSTVINHSYDYKWSFNKSDSNLDIYWSKEVYGIEYNPNLQKIEEFELKEIKTLWDEFSKKFNVPIENLHSCYMNALTFGVEAYPHVDFDQKGSTTVIIYLCESWNSFWSGETVFFDHNFVPNEPANEVFYQHDIIKSVLPKYNRMVLFDASIIHAVRPISKSFKGLRKTLMFKLKNISIQQIMKNYKCN